MDSRHCTLFVVDDEAAVRASLVALASSMGLACETFASAEQFLQRFHPSLSGCVVIDVRMPGMDGIQLQEQLLARGSTLPVILVTGYASVPSVVRAMRNGAATVLEKPCDADKLEDAVRRATNAYCKAAAEARRQADLRRRFDNLDPREREAMALIVNGMPNKTIARELGVSQRTVDRIRAGICATMEAESAVDLAGMAGELWRLDRRTDAAHAPCPPAICDAAVRVSSGWPAIGSVAAAGTL